MRALNDQDRRSQVPMHEATASRKYFEPTALSYMSSNLKNSKFRTLPADGIPNLIASPTPSIVTDCESLDVLTTSANRSLESSSYSTCLVSPLSFNHATEDNIYPHDNNEAFLSPSLNSKGRIPILFPVTKAHDTMNFWQDTDEANELVAAIAESGDSSKHVHQGCVNMPLLKIFSHLTSKITSLLGVQVPSPAFDSTLHSPEITNEEMAQDQLSNFDKGAHNERQSAGGDESLLVYDLQPHLKIGLDSTLNLPILKSISTEDDLPKIDDNYQASMEPQMSFLTPTKRLLTQNISTSLPITTQAWFTSGNYEAPNTDTSIPLSENNLQFQDNNCKPALTTIFQSSSLPKQVGLVGSIEDWNGKSPSRRRTRSVKVHSLPEFVCSLKTCTNSPGEECEKISHVDPTCAPSLPFDHVCKNKSMVEYQECETDSGCKDLHHQPQHEQRIESLPSQKAENLILIGSEHDRKGDYSRALHYYKKAYAEQSVHDQAEVEEDTLVIENTMKSIALASILHRIGLIEWKSGNYTSSSESLQQAANTMRPIWKDTNLFGLELSDILTSLGRVNTSLGQHDDGMNNCIESLQILRNLLVPSEGTGMVVSGMDEKTVPEQINTLITHDQSHKSKNKREGFIFHPAVARSLQCIGVIYDRCGKYSIAKHIFYDAIHIQRNTVGTSHIDFATSVNALGSVYEKIGKSKKAMRCFKKAKQIYIRELGEYHVDVAVALNNIGQIYHDLGNFNKSMAAYESGLNVMITIVGENHRNVSAIRHNIGLLLMEIGRVDEAMMILKDVLKSQRKSLGDNHIDIATTLDSIGEIYVKKGKLQRGLKLYHKSLQIRRKVLGTKNLHVGLSLDRIGKHHLFHAMKEGSANDAVRVLKEALEIYRLNCLPDSDFRVSTATSNLQTSCQLQKHRSKRGNS